MSDPRRIPVNKLVFDTTLWPREMTKVPDQRHVRKMRHTLAQGRDLPPIIVSQKSPGFPGNVIADGWHRATAYRKERGPEARVPCVVRRFRDRAHFLWEAVELNSGEDRALPIREEDQRNIRLKLDQAGVGTSEIALALHVPEPVVERLAVEIAYVTEQPEPIALTEDAEPFALSPSCSHLRGQVISSQRRIAIDGSPGVKYTRTVQQVVTALRFNLLPRTEKIALLLDELREALDAYE